MNKNILFSLIFLVAVSCVPAQAAQAAQSKSTWTVFKNSAKILIGTWFVWSSGIKTAIDAATFDKEQALANFRQAYAEQVAQVQARGGEDLDATIAMMNIMKGFREASIENRGFFGIWNLGWTAGGVALIYSGVKCLTEEEEPAKA